MNATGANHDGRCHSCGAGPLRVFYEVRRIPVHSTLLMASPEQARAYPTGDLRLGFCRACGFVQNNLFDPSVHEYSVLCEESQGFSARFNQFLREVTRGLIDRYGIRNKTVLEIGCGKGDWLELICALGENRGIGIDPGIIPERQQSQAAARIRFVRDLYGEKFAEVSADVIACRHTLEHIQPTRDLLRLVRRAAGDRRDTLVFFEVPDVLRVLKEAAFWDVYYEHCSYFSLGSLARLFRSCDFEVLDLWLGFGEQYLLITARPGRGPSDKTFSGEDDLAALERGVDHFEKSVRELRTRWERALASYRSEGKRVVVWGSSSKGVAFLTTLGVSDQVGYVVDINPFRQSKFMPGTGHEIVGPEKMVEYRPDVVVVTNPIYTEEIGAQLRGLGVHAQLVPL
jgi:SAM-dependent methyltransferase